MFICCERLRHQLRRCAVRFAVSVVRSAKPCVRWHEASTARRRSSRAPEPAITRYTKAYVPPDLSRDFYLRPQLMADRKSVVLGKGVYVRVNQGGPPTCNKKKK